MNPWRKIPGAFPQAHYEIHVPWTHLERWLEGTEEDYSLNLSPDYQRAHVWTERQQRAYVEYCLQGGEGSQVLYWNSIGWDTTDPHPVELVDGKQRLEAVRRFLRGELTVFRDIVYDPSGPRMPLDFGFKMKIAALPTRHEVLHWYLAINAGGTPHTEEELDRVRKLLDEEKRNEH